MTWPWIVFTYLNVWWISIFLVLPWGNRAPDVIGEGHSSGAPAKPRLRLKLLINTAIAALFTAIIVLAMDAGIISLTGDSQ